MKKVAINGFGRIGRAYLRLAQSRKDIEVVAVNDLTDSEMGAYLLRHDTVYGGVDEEVTATEEALRIGKKSIAWFSLKNPSALPWRTMGVDVVIEATGVFASYEKAYAHIIAGAKHVIISAPVKDPPPENVAAGMVLVGINEKEAKNYTITSNASCTTNAVGIPLSLLDAGIGVKHALLSTVHSYTSTQNIVDGPSSKKNDYRIGRAGACNIIPSTTGAAIATTEVLPHMKGHFDGVSLRVPSVSGSLVDLTFVTSRETTVKEINEVLQKGESALFTATTDPVVSSDIIGKPYVSIADLPLTKVIDGTLAKVFLWYDNEYGYAQSLIYHTRYV